MLDVAAIRAQLGGAGLGASIRALGSVSSTNDVAWAWAEAGCAEGTVVLAEEQVRGRGRFGRTWHCPRGRGLLMSVVLRPAGEGVGPLHLTAVAAVAVAEAIEELAGLPAGIQWPNDVTVRDRKVAGVLVERRGSRASSPCVVGVGVNVNVGREEFPEELRERATSLAAEAGRELEVECMAAATLRRLDALYRQVGAGGWAAVAAAWRARCSLVGETADVETEGRLLRGRVVEADPLAGIELELADGERRQCQPDSATRVLPLPTARDRSG